VKDILATTEFKKIDEVDKLMSDKIFLKMFAKYTDTQFTCTVYMQFMLKSHKILAILL
jgi:hypothetical protein